MAWIIKRKDKSYTRTVTLAELIDAIEQNGLKQAFGKYWYKGRVVKAVEVEEGERIVGQACALGQGALNLGLHYTAFQKALNDASYDANGPYSRPGDDVIAWNDQSKFNLQEIAKKLREKYSDRLGNTTEITVKYDVRKDN